MERNIIALGVGLAMAAPFAAQAEVNISGSLQAEIVNLYSAGAGTRGNGEGLYVMDGAEDATENEGNNGFLKFAASEDLGNGVKAIAVYNMKIAVDNILDTRDAFIGLSGDFGTILAGRLSTPYKTSTVKWDPFLATFAQARGSNGMVGDLHNGYVNNAIDYANKFGMAKVVAAIVLDEAADPADAAKTSGKNGVSFSVNMPVGPVELALAYIDVSEHQDPVNGGPYAKDAAATKIGVKYTAGAITVAAQQEMLAKGLGDYNVTYITGSYTMGANTFSASYGMDDRANDPYYGALGVKHAFSKNVSATAAYRLTHGKTGYGAVQAMGVGVRIGF